MFYGAERRTHARVCFRHELPQCTRKDVLGPVGLSEREGVGLWVGMGLWGMWDWGCVLRVVAWPCNITHKRKASSVVAQCTAARGTGRREMIPCSKAEGSWHISNRSKQCNAGETSIRTVETALEPVKWSRGDYTWTGEMITVNLYGASANIQQHTCRSISVCARPTVLQPSIIHSIII